MKKTTSITFSILIIASMVSAVNWTPPGNVVGKNTYSILDFYFINATYFSMGGVSLLNSSSSLTWQNLENYPSACGANTWVATLADSPTCTGIAQAIEVPGNITPASNITYDLGNSTKMWKDIYINRSCYNPTCTQATYVNESGWLIISS